MSLSCNTKDKIFPSGSPDTPDANDAWSPDLCSGDGGESHGGLCKTSLARGYGQWPHTPSAAWKYEEDNAYIASLPPAKAPESDVLDELHERYEEENVDWTKETAYDAVMADDCTQEEMEDEYDEYGSDDY